MPVFARNVVLILALAAPAAAVVIDRIAAIVDRQVITLSEVEQVAGIRLYPRLAEESDSAYRRRVLDGMIAQLLRYRDVELVGAEDVPKDSIEARLQEMIARFESPEAFEETINRLELSIDEVRALIRRQLQVDAYIEERFAPLIFISLEEIDTYYREVWAPQRRARGLTVQPLSEVRETIRTLLRAERLDAEVSQWTRQLRSRANVDIYVYQ